MFSLVCFCGGRGNGRLGADKGTVECTAILFARFSILENLNCAKMAVEDGERCVALCKLRIRQSLI